MLKNILAFVSFIVMVIQAQADPVINTFKATPSSSGQIKVSTTTATSLNVQVTVSRSWNPLANAWEGVTMTMNVILRASGTADEVLGSAISVTTPDFNNSPYSTKNFTVSIPANKQGRYVYLKYSYTTPQGVFYGPLLSTTYYLTTLNDPPPPGGDPNLIHIVPDQRSYTQMVEESNSNVELPPNTVMTGRFHLGDENGSTNYQYATLKAVDYWGQPVAGTITVEVVGWSEWKSEYFSNYYVPAGYVMTGRQHYGDEKANTRYRYSIVKFNGKQVTVPQEEPFVDGVYIAKESESGSWTPPANMVLIGRSHDGDENGKTWYIFSAMSTTR